MYIASTRGQKYLKTLHNHRTVNHALTTSFSRWKIFLQSSSISHLHPKMDAVNRTFKEEFRGYAFQELYGEHYVALLNVGIFALILGSLLEWNVLWHLRVRLSNAPIDLICEVKGYQNFVKLFR